MAAFETINQDNFWKLNLDQAVGNHDNNLDCKGLMLKLENTLSFTGQLNDT